MSKPGYNLDNYQCQPGHEPLIYQRHYQWARSCTLSMSQLGHDLELSMSQLGLDLHNLLWRGLLMPQLGYDPQPVYQNREQLPSRRKKKRSYYINYCISVL